jgi:fermentation-respiration switch protein FrsA (DUF1100 family)
MNRLRSALLSCGLVLGLSAPLVGCTLDGFMFNGELHDGPYDFTGTTIPSDRFDPEGTFVTASDGTQIHLQFVRSSGDATGRADTTIFYCHGNSTNLLHYWDRVELFYELGYQTLIFDYRGYGRSDDVDGSEAGIYADAEAAYDHLLTRPEVNPDKIVFYGYSLGGAPCVELAHRYADQPAALITEAIFRSVEDLLQDGAGASLHVSMVSDLRFDNFAKIDGVNTPLLVIHGREDSYVPVEYGIELHAQAREPKALYLVPGAEHSTVPGDLGSENRQTYLDTVAAFLDTHVP